VPRAGLLFLSRSGRLPVRAMTPRRDGSDLVGGLPVPPAGPDGCCDVAVTSSPCSPARTRPGPTGPTRRDRPGVGESERRVRRATRWPPRRSESDSGRRSSALPRRAAVAVARDRTRVRGRRRTRLLFNGPVGSQAGSGPGPLIPHPPVVPLAEVVDLRRCPARQRVKPSVTDAGLRLPVQSGANPEPAYEDRAPGRRAAYPSCLRVVRCANEHRFRSGPFWRSA
jgi:hypothetical protein